MERIGNWCVLGLISFVFTISGLHAQEIKNTAERMLQDDQKLTLGGYGQIDFNQPLEQGTFNNGNLDVHRMVLMFGYKFNEKTQFISEVEFEHVKEVFVEQAFLQYEITSWLKFRGGLMLVPMGIINEYHEPSTFNGVERPNVDKYIVPSTWREIGAGFTGVLPAAGISYQLYTMNGFNGYDGAARLSGANGFRKGRQKGAESYMSSPNLTFRINYFGVRGLQLGLSGSKGPTQSTLYDGIDKSDANLVATADSSAVGVTMLGVDARYSRGGLMIRAQYNYGTISNTTSYNEFTGSDLGSAISGWYAELSYDVLQSIEKYTSGLIPFIRFEKYNTHQSVEGGLTVNEAFDRSDLTMGLGWKLDKGAMLKVDYQVFSNAATDESSSQLNAGVAVWF